MQRFLRHFLKDERGSPAAEMALMLPLLLILVFSSMEGAYYLYLEHQVVKGVRDGARFAARQSFTYYDCGSTGLVNDSGSPSVTDQIKNVTRTGSTSSSANSRVPGWSLADTTVIVACPGTAVNTGIYAQMANAPQVTVSATVSYPSLFAALSGIGVNVNLNASQQAAVMGV